MFEENGRELVWTFFVGEKVGARLEIYDIKKRKYLGFFEKIANAHNCSETFVDKIT